MQEASRRQAANQCMMPAMNGYDPQFEASADAPVRELYEPRLEQVRGAGAWLPWAGFALAVLWWGSVAATLVTVLDISAMGRQPPITLAAGALIALMPGFLLLMAGFMARESVRAASANALVLQASERLLDPAARAGSRAESLAGQMAASAAEVDRAMNHALSAMKAMAEEIGDERMRLESVSYVAADNARDLGERLASERGGLEALARNIKTQTDEMALAIPRHAETMIASARHAAEELGRADEALDARLNQMQESTGRLSSELARLDQLAAGAKQHSEALTFAVARVEEKLERSRGTVEQALKSGELAAAAAGTTGDAIQAAAEQAIAGARQAQQEIQSSTRSAHEEAARALAILQQRADDVAAAIKAAGMAARAETDMTERRLSQVGSAFRSAVASGETTAPPPSERPARVESPPPAPAPAPPPSPPASQAAAPVTRPPAPAPMKGLGSSPRHVDEDLFEAGAGVPLPPRNWTNDNFNTPSSGAAAPTSPPVINGTAAYDANEPADDTDALDPFEETDEAEITSPRDVPPPPPRGDAAWTSILSDIDRSDSGQLPREDTAEHVITRLENSGIALASIFRPRDKKKIALAARKGEEPRRNAILSTARGEVERVAKRLQADEDLVRLAHDFLAMEAPDAIAALDRTQKSSRNASPRLSAFLLLDAAVGDYRSAA